MEPPPFHESARCDVCKCSFNTFRRRHHCRCCGRTLCYEHSSNQMALPQFGIHSLVRVCADCYNNPPQPAKGGREASVEGVDRVTDSVSKLDIGDVVPEEKPIAEHQPGQGVPDCKCGMPLCICEAPAPFADALHLQRKTTSTTSQSNQRPKRDPVPKNRASASTSNNSSALNAGQISNGAPERPKMDYDVNGEGLREAIKNDDAAAVKKLLSEGVDPNYHDKQGMSLLHLAAVFNRTDSAFILMEHGASVDYRNAQGETPLDCAPATLQYKMRQKMEDGC
ncbi:hypothetical protein BT93_D1518 [Corymbia citriodora subsp. variegata]|nr:hypothetical protein BT93_D1518 [Corymbia citriodora subsp. variegata]